MRSHFGALILIVLGAIFLGINLGYIPAAQLRILFAQWWPAILILVGVLLLVRPRHRD